MAKRSPQPAANPLLLSIGFCCCHPGRLHWAAGVTRLWINTLVCQDDVCSLHAKDETSTSQKSRTCFTIDLRSAQRTDFLLSLKVNKLQSGVKYGLVRHWIDRASYSSVADVTNAQTDSPYWSKPFAETPFESTRFSAWHLDMNDKTKPGMQMCRRKSFLCCKNTFPLSKSWVNVAQLITARKRWARWSTHRGQEGKSNSMDLNQQLTAWYQRYLFSPCARIRLTPVSPISTGGV